MSRWVLAAGAALAAAATVWFAVTFVNAGRVAAGPGGRARVAVASLQRTERASATVRFAGALLLIATGTLVARRALR